MDGRRPPGLPSRCPALRACCTLCFARRDAVSTAVQAQSLPPRLLSPSLRASVYASAPPPRLRLPPLRASTPAGRTESEARRCAGCWAGGRRAWAEPGAGARGWGWAPGSLGCRRRSSKDRKEKTGGKRCGAGGGGGGSESGTEVTKAGLWRASLGTQRAGRGRSLPPTPDAQPALSAPTYPRERPAGYIPTPPPPLALQAESAVSQPRTGTQRHREAHVRAHSSKQLYESPLSTLRPRDACCSCEC